MVWEFFVKKGEKSRITFHGNFNVKNVICVLSNDKGLLIINLAEGAVAQLTD